MDIVVDPVGGSSTARSWPVMRAGGILVGIAEAPDPGCGGRDDVRGHYLVVRPDGGQLRLLSALIDKQQFRAVVSEVYELADLQKAFGSLLEIRPPGKVVISTPHHSAMSEVAGHATHAPGIPLGARPDGTPGRGHNS